MFTEDLILVIGIVILVFAIPAIFGAIADRRTPRTPAIMVLIGGSLIVLAITQKPGGYTVEDVPQAFIRVVAHYFR